MKCRILTAHGYLSFQPPLGNDPSGEVTLQYRPSPGPWEEFDLEGWDVQPIVPPAGGTTPPPGFVLPGNIPPSETAEYVGAIKSWLLSQGKNLSGPCGAFEIVANVAWGVSTLGTGAGLLNKPGGNNCQAYSTDIIAYRDGSSTRIVDVLGDGGNGNYPNWQEKGPEENVELNRWRPPIDPASATGRTTVTSTVTSVHTGKKR